MGKGALRDLRAHTVSMVYQEPGRALNPSLRVGGRSRRCSSSPAVIR
jgi:ABC-type dipeptide/oligopeptide/nickel transport system ATPase component